MNTAEDAYFFFNNQIVSSRKAVLQLHDLGLFRGYAAFDYLRTHNGKPLLLEHYLKRFRHSAEAMRLPLKMPDAALAEIIEELLERNGQEESGIRLLLSGGDSADLFTPAEPNLIIRIEKSSMPAGTFYTKGATLVTNEYQRDWHAVKHTNYMNAIRNQPRVQAAGAVEVLYYWRSKVLECSRSNFFIVKDARLITPPTEQVLSGVTRQQVLDLAQAHDIATEERPVNMEEVLQADEAFITATTKRVMPVVRIDHHQLGKGEPGPISRKLLELWKKHIES